MPRLTKNERMFGSRANPRMFLTAEAAVAFCKQTFQAIWVRLPMYDGKFHIWPGGRKEFYPDGARTLKKEDGNG